LRVSLSNGLRSASGLGKLRSKHMTDKSSFTPEEWKLLLESVTMAGIAVTAADPSGLWGLLKEVLRRAAR
jgi:hypothetical protein